MSSSSNLNISAIQRLLNSGTRPQAYAPIGPPTYRNDQPGQGLAVVTLGYDEAAISGPPQHPTCSDCACYSGNDLLLNGRFTLEGDTTIAFNPRPYSRSNEGLGAYLVRPSDTFVAIPVYVPPQQPNALTITIIITIGSVKITIIINLRTSGRILKLKLRRLNQGGVWRWVLVNDDGVVDNDYYRDYSSSSVSVLGPVAVPRLPGPLTDTTASLAQVSQGGVQYPRGELVARAGIETQLIQNGIGFLVPSAYTYGSSRFYRFRYENNAQVRIYTVAAGELRTGAFIDLGIENGIGYALLVNDDPLGLDSYGSQLPPDGYDILLVPKSAVVPLKPRPGHYTIELVPHGTPLEGNRFSIDTDASVVVRVEIENTYDDDYYTLDLVSGGAVVWRYNGSRSNPLTHIVLARDASTYVPYQRSVKTPFERASSSLAFRLYGISLLPAPIGADPQLLLRVLPGGRREVVVRNSLSFSVATPVDTRVYEYYSGAPAERLLLSGNGCGLSTVDETGAVSHVSTATVELGFRCSDFFARGAALQQGHSRRAFDVARSYKGVADRVYCCAPVSDPDEEGIEFFVPSSFGFYEALHRAASAPGITRLLIYVSADTFKGDESTKDYLRCMPLPVVCGPGTQAQAVQLLHVAPLRPGHAVSVAVSSIVGGAEGSDLMYDQGYCPLSVVRPPGSLIGTSISLADMFETCGHGRLTAQNSLIVVTPDGDRALLNWGGHYISGRPSFSVSLSDSDYSLTGHQMCAAEYPRPYQPPSADSLATSSVTLLLDHGPGEVAGLDVVYGTEYGAFTGPRGRVVTKTIGDPSRSPTAFRRTSSSSSMPLMVLAGPGGTNASYVRSRTLVSLTRTSVAEQSRQSRAKLFSVEPLNTTLSSAAGFCVAQPETAATYFVTEQPPGDQLRDT